MTRWSDGLPFPGLGSIGGIATGEVYHFPSVVMIGSRIAGGVSLVCTLTSCFRSVERLKIGFKLKRLKSPQIPKGLKEVPC